MTASFQFLPVLTAQSALDLLNGYFFKPASLYFWRSWKYVEIDAVDSQQNVKYLFSPLKNIPPARTSCATQAPALNQ